MIISSSSSLLLLLLLLLLFYILVDLILLYCFVLVAELKKLRSSDQLHNDLSYDLSKSRYYAMLLERKLRDALKSPGSGDLEKSLSSSLQSLEASNAEVERYINMLIA